MSLSAPGSFQHSSFLGGGVVTSAGLISVKDGLIHTLSPLSGHYRCVLMSSRPNLVVDMPYATLQDVDRGQRVP